MNPTPRRLTPVDIAAATVIYVALLVPLVIMLLPEPWWLALAAFVGGLQ